MAPEAGPLFSCAAEETRSRSAVGRYRKFPPRSQGPRTCRRVRQRNRLPLGSPGRTRSGRTAAAGRAIRASPARRPPGRDQGVPAGSGPGALEVNRRRIGRSRRTARTALGDLAQADAGHGRGGDDRRPRPCPAAPRPIRRSPSGWWMASSGTRGGGEGSWSKKKAPRRQPVPGRSSEAIAPRRGPGGPALARLTGRAPPGVAKLPDGGPGRGAQLPELGRLSPSVIPWIR